MKFKSIEKIKENFRDFQQDFLSNHSFELKEQYESIYVIALDNLNEFLIQDENNFKTNYYVVIELPNGLKTSYKKELIFDKEMQGSAEIVTEDLRLIERVFYQFRELFQFQ